MRQREGRGKLGIKLKDLVLEWESRNITSIGRNKTLQEYRAKQRAFLEWAKNIDIADLNADLVNGFIDHLFTEHDFAKKTLKKYYTAASRNAKAPPSRARRPPRQGRQTSRGWMPRSPAGYNDGYAYGHGDSDV